MEKEHDFIPERTKWKRQLFRIIFKSDTKWGKTFDMLLLFLILLSTFIVMMESVQIYDAKLHQIFVILEIIITIIFTVEYILRVITIRNKKDYVFSFFGIICLVKIKLRMPLSNIAAKIIAIIILAKFISSLPSIFTSNLPPFIVFKA